MRTGMLMAFCSTVLLSVSIFAQVGVQPEGFRRGNILYVNLPNDLAKENIEFASQAVKARLHRLATNLAGGVSDVTDLIVVFVDRNGRAILPNRESAGSQMKLSALSTAAALPNELMFTFASPVYPWTSTEVQTLSSMLNTFYPVIRQVYGSPAFNLIVNVRKDPAIPNGIAGLYYPGFNEIVLRGLDTDSLDVLCHELIHAFRDDNIVWLDSYEEGMTRAAEVEVFNRLPAYEHWDENHQAGYDIFYEAMNKPKIGSAGGEFFNGYVSPLLRYQLAGYAWAKPLLVNDRFFSDFNSIYYSRVLLDPNVAHTESALIDIAAGLQASVEAIPFQEWYSRQNVFGTAPPQGYFLYKRFQSGAITVDYFQRNSAGVEFMQANSLVQWVVSDFQGVPVSNGSGVTSAYGWVSLTPNVPDGYTGRIQIEITANSPQGTIRDTSLTYVGDETGVFGVVKDGAFGLLTITPVDGSIGPVTVNVTNGGFSVPVLAGLRGGFEAVFQEPGVSTVSRQFAKDASHYFLVVGSPDGAPSRTANLSGVSPQPGTVVLSWTDNSTNETAFEISRRAPGMPPATVSTVAANVTTATFSGLTPSESNDWYVRACNAAGCSAWLGPLRKNADGSATVPAKPDNLSAGSTQAGTIVLNWTDKSTTETRFDIGRAAPGGSPSVVKTLAADVATTTITNLNSGTTYDWYVRACNAAGCSAWLGAVRRAADGADARPARPTNLRATSPQLGSILLRWSDMSSNETSFEIGRASDGNPRTTVRTVGANATSTTFTGLNRNVSYQWYVRACNAGGCSSWLGPVTKRANGS
jgi:hypothetical protein